MSYTPSKHHTTQPAAAPLPREARRELALIFGVFVTARLMAVWWFQPLHTEIDRFFFPFGWLQGRGIYPFVHYWLEYPPVLAYSLVGLRALAAALCGTGSVAWESHCLVRAVQLFSIVWETASLALIYAMAKLLRGPKAAARACWLYVGLFSTAFVALSYLETFPVFLVLAAIFLAVYSRPVWSAAVVGVGFMAKLFPIAVLPAALKCEPKWRWRLAPLAAFLLVALGIGSPFLVRGGRWLGLFFEATARRAPWQTVWALIDKNHQFGYVGPPREAQNDAFFTSPQFGVVPGTKEILDSAPPDVFGPPPVQNQRTIYYYIASHFATKLDFVSPAAGKGGAYGWVYGAVGIAAAFFYAVTFAFLPAALPPRRRVFFAAFTVFALFLCAKGWSPQFVAYLVPLLLIAFPLEEAGLWAVLLTVIAFLEMPVWAAFVHGHPGMVVADLLLLQATVIARTALLLVVTARLYPRLFRD